MTRRCRLAYMCYLGLLICATLALGAQRLHAQCDYIDCWAGGFPSYPCGDCGSYQSWAGSFTTDDCHQCFVGNCVVYAYYNDLGGPCYECYRSFVQQCLTA